MATEYLMRLFPGEPSAAEMESLFLGCAQWLEESGTYSDTSRFVTAEEATSTAQKKSNPRNTKGTGRRKRKPVMPADEGLEYNGNGKRKNAGSLASSGGAAPVASRSKRGRQDGAAEDGGNKKGRKDVGCNHPEEKNRVKGMCRPCYMKQYKAKKREEKATESASSSASMQHRPRRGV